MGLYSGGVLLGGGTVSTGANGYIYLAVAAGTLGASGDKIGADLTLAGGASPTGLVYTDAGSVDLRHPDPAGAHRRPERQTTGELTYSALHADLSADLRRAAYAGLQTALAATPLTITATGASFTVNQTLSSAGLTIQTGAGAPLTIADPITLTGTGALSLDAGGALAHRRADLGHRRGPGGADRRRRRASASTSDRAASPARCRTRSARAKASPARR